MALRAADLSPVVQFNPSHYILFLLFFQIDEDEQEVFLLLPLLMIKRQAYDNTSLFLPLV